MPFPIIQCPHKYFFLPQIRKSFFAELGFYENDTLVRIMYEDFIKGTMDADERDKAPPEMDPKRAAFYDVSNVFNFMFSLSLCFYLVLCLFLSFYLSSFLFISLSTCLSLSAVHNVSNVFIF